MSLKIGDVCLATAGRDKGRYYVVLKTEGNYAYIADGDLRKASHLKKKSKKHLRIISTDKALVEKINCGLSIGNETLKKLLKPYKE